MKRFVIFLVCAFFLSFCGWGCKKQKNQCFSIATWNVQTFFDDETCGTEYADFTSKKSPWNEDLYQIRLERIVECFEFINADVLVLQEIENENVMQDIINALPPTWGYKFCSFAKDDLGVLGCGVFSKFEIIESKTHQCTIAKEGPNSAKSILRPLVEVPIKIGKNQITLFLCHWKSKKNETLTDEHLRTYQQSLLVSAIDGASKDSAVIALGDFNQDVTEFSIKENKVLLCGINKNIFAYSPWLLFKNENQQGSYFYKRKWECIDNIFLVNNGKNASFLDFSVINSMPFVKEDGTPFRFTVYSGNGYSDHLPIKATISLN